MDISIIILAYKNKEKLRTTLEAVRRSKTNYSYETIVVDNDSQDGTAEMVEKEFVWAKLIRNSNSGFAAGNNIGIKQSSGRIILLLNPDTEVGENAIEETAKFLDSRADVGIVSCKLIKENGELDLACRREIPNPWNALMRFLHLDIIFNNSKWASSYNLLYKSVDEEGEVGSVSGAYLMIKREVIDKTGLLDESFFMYGEDLDWCYRCTQAGYKVWYYPKVATIHYKGQSSKKVPFRSLKWFHDAMWIFYRKHYGKKYPFFFSCLVWLGIYGRMTVLSLKSALTPQSKRYVSK